TTRGAYVGMAEDGAHAVQIHAGLDEETGGCMSKVVETDTSKSGMLNRMRKCIRMTSERQAPEGECDVVHNRHFARLARFRNGHIDQVSLDVDRPKTG